MNGFGEEYDIKDMSGNTEETGQGDENSLNKVIKLNPANTEWRERKTKKGEKMFYRKYENKYINVGFFKSKHLWITYDGAFVKDHNIKYIDDKQLFNDVDNILDLIVNIAN